MVMQGAWGILSPSGRTDICKLLMLPRKQAGVASVLP